MELYRHKKDIQNVVDCKGLEANVLDYMNSQPPCPGADAELTSSEAIGSKRFGDVLESLDSDALYKLQHEGYVVIDTGMHSSTKKLNEWANKSKTGQESSRTDTVAFLNRNDCVECDLEDEYDFMLTLASHLNDNFDLYASPYKPIHPATKDKPLTNPFNVQMAEYGWKDHYNAHSDNSIDMRERTSNAVFEGYGTTISDDYILSDCDNVLPKKRSNYRCITAILYLNENWEKCDGGQLRMYLDSAAVERPNRAVDTHDYVDINPSNGKLLLFDSRMVHSVEEVLNKYKIRRALTLWTRPEESGVSGEDYFISS